MGPTKSSQADVWVTKWVDYSTKYGMGYLLLNGATGVYYNDGTKIVLSPCGTYFDYIEKSTAISGGTTIESDNGRSESLSTFKMDQYPKELTKKVALLQQFKKYLVEKSSKEDGGFK